MTPNIVTEDFIKDRVDISDNGCWMWNRCCDRDGYGAVSVSGKQLRASRLSYQFYNGSIPDGMIVRHTCDAPGCCNPEHLIIGTYADNTGDMYRRGRASTGGSHGTAKLTDADVRAIRKDARATTMICKEYGVSNVTIGMIRRGKTWKHLDTKTAGVSGK